MPDHTALFLDVDGTLLPFADSPWEARADAPLVGLLRQLSWRSGGAVAFVSGRPIHELDALFAPLRLPAAGLHGFERRTAEGAYWRHPLPPVATLEAARARLRALAAAESGLLLEDKRVQLALHYRRAPALQARVIGEMQDIVERAGPAFELQRGNHVVELRPAGVSKGTAVRDFMAERPFKGRRPVYVGDDLTDESAFEWINSAGGQTVCVGAREPTLARQRLADPTAVRAWLQGLLGNGNRPRAVAAGGRRARDAG